MNTEAIRTEIEKIVSDNRNKLRGARQYPVSKVVQAELEELGIFQFIPQWMNRGYVGLSDAKAVLAAAKQAKNTSAVFNAYGEGDDVETPESELHRLLNEQPESAARIARPGFRVGDIVSVAPHTVYSDLRHGAVESTLTPHPRPGARAGQIVSISADGAVEIEIDGFGLDVVDISHLRPLDS